VNYAVRRCCDDWLPAGALAGTRRPWPRTSSSWSRCWRSSGTSGCGTCTSPTSTRHSPRQRRRRELDGGDGAFGADQGLRARPKHLVLRNVSALSGTPPGLEGRPSRGKTLAQATALTAAAKASGPRTQAYGCCRCVPGCAPRRHGRPGGKTPTSVSRMAIRCGRRAWRCGGRCLSPRFVRTTCPAGCPMPTCLEDCACSLELTALICTDKLNVRLTQVEERRRYARPCSASRASSVFGWSTEPVR
jgi:hypothetical protein